MNSRTIKRAVWVIGLLASVVGLLLTSGGAQQNPDGTLKWKFQTRGDVYSSPAIGADGTIYVGSHDGYLYAINSSSRGLAASPWPMFHHDIQHTGRVEAQGLMEREPNDSQSAANAFAIPFQVRGTIAPAGDRDFFSFAISGTRRVTMDIDAEAIGSELDSEIVLYKDGSQIASNGDTDGRDSYLNLSLSPGIYYIEVKASGDNSTGQYVLTVFHH